jgi:hypothetical protein
MRTDVERFHLAGDINTTGGTQMEQPGVPSFRDQMDATGQDALIQTTPAYTHRHSEKERTGA